MASSVAERVRVLLVAQFYLAPARRTHLVRGHARVHQLGENIWYDTLMFVHPDSKRNARFVRRVGAR